MFSIDSDKNITYSEQPVSGALNFSTLKALENLTDTQKWSREYLEEVWNSFAGVAGPFGSLKPVKKFRNRPYGLQQIWAAIQRLAPVTEQAAVAALPNPAPKTKEKPKKPAKAKKSKVLVAEKLERRAKAREEVVRLISRKTGASVEELMEAMEWQRHTVRGYISTLGSKHGYKINAEKTEKLGLVYRAA